MGNHIFWGGVGEANSLPWRGGSEFHAFATSLASAWIIEPVGVKSVGSALSAPRYVTG